MRAVVCVVGLAAIAAAFVVHTPVAAHRRITTTVTWDREVSAILAARCVQCHRPGGRAPMPLTTYAEARPWARAIRHEVVTRRMPLWHAARGYGEFANDPSLSPHEISLIAAWADGGAPQTLVPFGSLPTKPQPSRPLTPAPPFRAPAATAVTRPCGTVEAPAGRLMGLRVDTTAGRDVRVMLAPANGEPAILAWIQNHDPKVQETYWLRQARFLGRQDQIVADGSAPCSVTLLMSSRRNQDELVTTKGTVTTRPAR